MRAHDLMRHWLRYGYLLMVTSADVESYLWQFGWGKGDRGYGDGFGDGDGYGYGYGYGYRLGDGKSE